MAGIWQGQHGVDVNPKLEGPRRQPFVERLVLQPVDPQVKGVAAPNARSAPSNFALRFRHTDRNALAKPGEQTPNPLARQTP